MKSFYKEWLKKIHDENSEAVISPVLPSTSAKPLRESSEPQQSVEPQPSTSKATKTLKTPQTLQTVSHQTPASQTDIIFETNDLQMIIEKGAFQRQKRFRFQDHLFYVKIKLNKTGMDRFQDCCKA